MSVASKPTPSSTLPSPFLMGLTSLEQLHSSVVIEKDTSSMTLFDSILPGALESVSAGEPPAPARGRGARGGRMRRAGGARGRGAAPLFRYQVVHFLEDNDVCLFVFCKIIYVFKF